ncbi:hypothetical protein [Christiangramia sp. SM2212]|uniref:Uncharacterized protein n=1 Tax=Christiangramia sediminicola TaxID=3073267 RepID=A0ABU1ER40_9FLAO|nr:hypothetical protein [Christiangramia sp. SM2212]MDR5590841.1 hypothetical protein [Christiangramia sp. SM2212]
MIKNLIIGLILMLSLQGIAQDTIQNTYSRKFIPKQAYIEHFKEVSDSSRVKVINGDTMVEVPMSFDPFAGENLKKVRYEQKDEDFLETYMNVAYHTDKKVDSSRFMKYWKEDIRIYFDESVPEADTKYLMGFAKKLSNEVDSLNISRNFIKEKSNYLVYYLNEDHNIDYEPRIGNKSGYYIHWNGISQITKGSLKINTAVVKNNLLKENLLKYHFFKSLGYFGSSKKLDCESILSNCNSYRVLTEKDLELLKYHYSYGVCKGTNLKSFNELTTSLNKKLEEDPNAILYVVHPE